MGEKDSVAFTGRSDADVELGVGRVREEGLNDEVGEDASSLLNLKRMK